MNQKSKGAAHNSLKGFFSGIAFSLKSVGWLIYTALTIVLSTLMVMVITCCIVACVLSVYVLNMVDKTTEEFSQLDNIIGGEIRIGCAESHLIKYLARSIKSFKEQYPNFVFHIFSGDTEPVAERLDRGLLDLAVIVEPPNLSKYNYLTIPESDKWGVVMRRDSPLAEKSEITFEDLYGLPLFCSEQSIRVDFPRWCGDNMDKLNFAGTVNLAYNGSVFVKEGLGYLLSFEHLIGTGEESGLCFRPITPVLETSMYIIWKKYQVFSPIAELFVRRLKDEFG